MTAEPLVVTETATGVIFAIHVQPRAAKNELCGIHGGALKVRLTSPPVEGAANRLCIELLAKLLDLAKSRITIIAGEKSRHKTIRIEGIPRGKILQLAEKTAPATK